MYKPPIQQWMSTLKAYERHISAAAMLGGFGFDFFAYGRVDHAVTQTLLIVYLGVAAFSIALLHWLEAHQEWESTFVAKLRAYLPALTQFVLGSLWSAFLVFYARSGVLAGSWPFLLILCAIFVGNEVFKRYHARLIFTTTLFFFALISYCAFMLPVFTKSIGVAMFLASGVVAVAVFAGFLWLLSKLSRSRLGEVKWQIGGSAVAVYALVTGLYFLDVLPPLPLAMQQTGVYHSICRVPARGAIRCVGTKPDKGMARARSIYYLAAEEPRSLLGSVVSRRTVHVEPGMPVIVFGAVFAPVDLNTTTYYVWRRYDDTKGDWETVQRLTNNLRGGRDKGYRNYSYKNNVDPGLWRVDVESVDGRLIGRTEFNVVNAPAPSDLKIVRL
ncbi:DUF2914 domain-containing protein [Rhizomicrobium electricum]|nr:DUF2914 domain-containing protein [Rhizomicrobium electricum]NIJ48473.1 hypothetical protein [Rhizomicrobium electricum]